MRRCRTCTMPDTRPDTEWVDGRCSACIAYERRPTIDWAERKALLLEVLARARETAKKRMNNYDVIVPSSGGKDSTYQVVTLQALGARVLVVTSSTCHLTPIGRANIDNLARHATTIEVSPNKEVRRKLNLIGLEQVGDISWPEHVGIFTIPVRAAKLTGIPFVFYGENPQNQYGGPLETQGARQMTERWRAEFGGFLGLRPQDLIGQEGLTEADMADYTLLPGDWEGMEAHFLGQYIPWDSHGNAAVAAQAGMLQQIPTSANLWAHENLDNAQTGLHDYGMFLKYGYGRGCAQAAVDVRTGLTNRSAALDWIAADDGGFPLQYAGVDLEDVLARLQIDRARMQRALDEHTNWKLFRRVEDSALAPAMPLFM